MPKSKYPNNLDTSIEIPAVRDNIIEVGSDVLNSLRSAIFQIERTLGLNPQGATGNSVADRINRSLDGNGNILKSALDRSNVLSGPITDTDVSKTAAVKESKLKLDFPTQLLQDEISQINNQLETFIDQLVALSSVISSHVHPDAVNRHYGQAIAILAIGSEGSSTATISTVDATAQEVFEELYSSHINYDGSDISLTNRSHEADQIFFDNNDVSAYVPSEDVQGAIEDVVGLTQGALDEHRNTFHKNGTVRNIVSNDLTNTDEGVLVADSSDVIFFDYDSTDTNNTSAVTMSESQDIGDFTIEKSDIVQITDGGETTEYQVLSSAVTDGAVDSLQVFGRFVDDATSAAQVKIYKNINQRSKQAGLLVATREDTGETSAKTVQISNPDAAAIVSLGCRPLEITTVNRYLSVTIDGDSTIDLDIYDGDSDRQTVDSIIKAMNDQFATNAVPCLAYRLDQEGGGSEIAIVHDNPSSSADSYTLMVSRGDDDAIDSLGFADYEDLTIDSQPGNFYYIQGVAYEGLGKKMEETGLTLVMGTSSITSSEQDFLSMGIADWDNINILGSSDDGTYRLDSVAEGRLVVDSSQLLSGFSAEVDDAVFTIYKNTVSFDSMTFDEIGTSSAASVVDIFMDKERNIFADKRLVYGIDYTSGAEAILSVIDFEGDIVESTLTIIATIDSVNETVLLSLDGGPEIVLDKLVDVYRDIYSGSGNIRLVLYIKDSASLYAAIDAISTDTLTMEIEAASGVNYEENLLLARVHYESQRGRVTGAGSSMPRSFSKLERGTLGEKDLSVDAKDFTAERPMRETRSNGAIRGLEMDTAADGSISADGFHVIDVPAGVCYVKGKRFEVSEHLNFITGLVAADVDKFFVAIDQWGNVVVAPADSVTCSCTLDVSSNCILGSIEWDGVTAVAIDLRLFIDNLDLTILNSIMVSPQEGMGHFTDINKALRYAKRFSEIFPNAGVPTVHLKSGVHRLNVDYGVAYAGLTDQIATDENYNQGIWINFPVTIEGEGDSTVLDISQSYTDYPISSDDRAINAGTNYNGNRIWVAGAGTLTTPAGDLDVLSSGFVTLKDFRMRMSWISFIDPDIKDGDGNKLNCGLNIDNVTFDWSENPTFAPDRFGASLWDRETADVCGNFNITNCQFLNSSIYLGPDASDCRNISILNNVFRGTGDTTAGGEENYAIYQSGTGNIFDLADAPAENNIEFRGNTIADHDSDSVSPAYVDAGGAHLWGDRISRDLYVGGNLSAGGDVSVGEDLSIGGSVVGDLMVDGSVGIGMVTSPEKLLHIEGTVPVIRLSDSDAATEADVVAYTEYYQGHDTARVGWIGFGSSSNRTLTIANEVSHTSGGDILLSATNNIEFEVDSAVIMTISDNDGFVGIGNNVPGSKLTVKDDSNSYVATFENISSDASPGGMYVLFDDDLAGAYKTGFILRAVDTYTGIQSVGSWVCDGDGTSTVEETFTGFHDTALKIDSDAIPGMIVESTGKPWVKNTDLSKKIISYSTCLPYTRLADSDSSSAVFGVTAIDSLKVNRISDEDGIKHLNSNYKGIRPGAFDALVEINGMDEGFLQTRVMSLGEGCVWVTNINGNINNGDLIESSVIKGHGRLQDDDIMRSKTVAKCTENIDWDSVTDNIEYNGEVYKRYLACVTFHCG